VDYCYGVSFPNSGNNLIRLVPVSTNTGGGPNLDEMILKSSVLLGSCPPIGMAVFMVEKG